MSTPAGQRRRHKHIHEQHEDLRVLLGRVERTEDPRGLDPLLRQLRDALAAHFAAEEGADGLAHAMGDAAQRYGEQLHKLEHEHELFLATLDELVQRCHGIVTGPMSALAADVHALVMALHAHERAETEMLSDALMIDLGGG